MPTTTALVRYIVAAVSKLVLRSNKCRHTTQIATPFFVFAALSFTQKCTPQFARVLEALKGKA